MGYWILLVVSAITLWVVSLFRVLYSSSSIPVNPSFLSNSNGSWSDERKRKVLLVVAHPDDESMFFVPTILYLSAEGHNLYMLFISKGDAEGKGNERIKEIYRACAVLKVPQQQIKILDHPELKDGFDKPWKHHLVSACAEEEIEKHGIDIVITFDNHGVSGHPNHRDVQHGLSMLVRNNTHRSIEAWELISTNVVRKYLGPMDVWMSAFFSLTCPRGNTYCLQNPHPLKCYQAMAQHTTQWVWYRKFFVLLSRYTYVNTLRRITSAENFHPSI